MKEALKSIEDCIFNFGKNKMIEIEFRNWDICKKGKGNIGIAFLLKYASAEERRKNEDLMNSVIGLNTQLVSGSLKYTLTSHKSIDNFRDNMYHDFKKKFPKLSMAEQCQGSQNNEIKEKMERHNFQDSKENILQLDGNLDDLDETDTVDGRSSQGSPNPRLKNESLPDDFSENEEEEFQGFDTVNTVRENDQTRIQRNLFVPISENQVYWKMRSWLEKLHQKMVKAYI